MSDFFPADPQPHFDPGVTLGVPLATMTPQLLVAAGRGWNLRRPLAGHGAAHMYAFQPALRRMRDAKQTDNVAAFEQERKGLLQKMGALTVADLLASADEMEKLLRARVPKTDPVYRAAAGRPIAALSTFLALAWITRAIQPEDTSP